MKYLAGLVLIFAATTGLAQTEAAQPPTPTEVLEQIFTEPLQDTQFTEQFSNAVSREQLRSLLEQIRGQLGEFQQVRGDSSPYTVVFSNGTATAEIALDSQGRVRGLRFTRLTPAVADLDEALSGFRDLSGDVSVLVLADGEVRAELNSDTPLAVGSAFKLLVLQVLAEQIHGGEHTWDEVVTLRSAWYSLPSGVLQDWPTGSALTLETLATLMISQSDNTATDALIDIVGRDALEARTDQPQNRPFLTTREIFILKAPDNRDLLERFQQGDEAEQRAVLEQVRGLELPSPDTLFTDGPVALDVEWYFSARQLCDLIQSVQSLDLTTVNPGVANPDDWARVSFKGGSEPGVLSLVTWLVGEDGSSYCVAATQNRSDEAVAEAEFVSLYSGLLSTLR
ncbi:MAG: serine hydrolase [Trueperaceae bacterium]|nr:serine hydrolase [Trueperaceae bacterium]